MPTVARSENSAAMLSDWELFAVAKKLIKEHGLEAADAALRRADDLAKRGDLDGEAVWLAVGRKIELVLADPSGLPN